MRTIKKNSIQRLIGFEGFTKYGVRTEKAEFGGEPPQVIVSFARKRASGNRCFIYYKCIRHTFVELCRPLRRSRIGRRLPAGAPRFPLCRLRFCGERAAGKSGLDVLVCV